MFSNRCEYLKFPISSFVRRLSQNCLLAEWGHYLQMRIFEPPCFRLKCNWQRGLDRKFYSLQYDSYALISIDIERITIWVVLVLGSSQVFSI